MPSVAQGPDVTTAAEGGPRGGAVAQRSAADDALNKVLDNTLLWRLSGALVLATLLCYAVCLRAGFVDWDDLHHVLFNPHVRAGLTVATLRWAFSALELSNWLPLTWLSHALDSQLYGAVAAGHHFTSVLLHCANTVILLILLHRMTGSAYRSALVAALFALHPLHVESVAWISERKDVLSALFGLLALWAYVPYAERPSLSRYGVVVLLFVLSLMAKPMLVTFPCLLLVMDFWPLRRRRAGVAGLRLSLLILEKLPLAALSVADSLVTLHAQRISGAVRPIDKLGIGQRLGNAAVAYVFYLHKMVLPTGLSFLYRHPGAWPAWQVTLSALILLGISTVCLWQALRRPYLLAGWLWYLGMLVPVIGLVQVGMQAYADRYTYLPLCGVFIALVWSLPASLWLGERRAGQSAGRLAALALGLAVLLALSAATVMQARTWHDTRALFARAESLDPQHYVALNGLGVCAVEQHDYPKALAYYERSLAAKEDFKFAHRNLGLLLVTLGRLPEALPHLLRARQLGTDLADDAPELGEALRAAGMDRQRGTAFFRSLARALRERGDLAAATYEARTCRECPDRSPDLREPRQGPRRLRSLTIPATPRASSAWRASGRRKPGLAASGPIRPPVCATSAASPPRSRAGPGAPSCSWATTDHYKASAYRAMLALSTDI